MKSEPGSGSDRINKMLELILTRSLPLAVL